MFSQSERNSASLRSIKSSRFARRSILSGRGLAVGRIEVDSLNKSILVDTSSQVKETKLVLVFDYVLWVGWSPFKVCVSQAFEERELGDTREEPFEACFCACEIKQTGKDGSVARGTLVPDGAVAVFEKSRGWLGH